MCSSNRGGDDFSFFRSKRPRFFKIILEDNIQAGKLVLPRTFVMEHGSSLPERVFLRVPSGAVWPVELAKHNNDVWLHHGWRVSADYCCLDYGRLLVFEHQGCSLFEVLVFDESSTEISYPYYSMAVCEKPKHDEKQKEPVIEKGEDDHSVEVLDDFIKSHRALERSLSPDTRPCKKKRNNSTSQIENDLESGSHSRETCSQCSEPETETSHSSAQEFVEKEGGESSAGLRCPKSHAAESTRSWRSPKQSEAFLRARAFRSKNPFCKMIMQPSYISGYALTIPKTFGKKYLANNQNPINLCVSDGRIWSVNCHRYGNKTIVKFLNGWREFMHDNRLKVGDVCVFELIEITELKLKVSIFRVDEDPTSDMTQGSGRRHNGEEHKRSLEKNIVCLYLQEWKMQVQKQSKSRAPELARIAGMLVVHN